MVFQYNVLSVSYILVLVLYAPQNRTAIVKVPVLHRESPLPFVGSSVVLKQSWDSANWFCLGLQESWEGTFFDSHCNTSYPNGSRSILSKGSSLKGRSEDPYENEALRLHKFASHCGLHFCSLAGSGI